MGLVISTHPIYIRNIGSQLFKATDWNPFNAAFSENVFCSHFSITMHNVRVKKHDILQLFKNRIRWCLFLSLLGTHWIRMTIIGKRGSRPRHGNGYDHYRSLLAARYLWRIEITSIMWYASLKSFNTFHQYIPSKTFHKTSTLMVLRQ